MCDTSHIGSWFEPPTSRQGKRHPLPPVQVKQFTFAEARANPSSVFGRDAYPLFTL